MLGGNHKRKDLLVLLRENAGQESKKSDTLTTLLIRIRMIKEREV